jgi:hypothetical protein
MFNREIVGLIGRRAILSCGHRGDYARLMQLGTFQFCAICKAQHQKEAHS